MSTAVLFREQMDVFGRRTDGLVEGWKKDQEAVQACYDCVDWIHLGLRLLDACEDGLAGWRRRVHRGGFAASEAASNGWKDVFRFWCEVARRGPPEGKRLSQRYAVDSLDDFSAAIQRVETMIACWRTPEASVLPGMRDVKLTTKTEENLLRAFDAAKASPR